MSSCLVPEFPAVLVALEHLGEIEKHLKNEGLCFHQEACHHLREIAGAVTELETSRRSARECLEVETIETSKLRYRVLQLPDEIMSEISASVAAARDSNAVQLNQLQTDMNNIIKDMDFMEKKQERLEEQNALLFPERELVQSRHEDVIDQLNHQLSEKAHKQILLNETYNQIRDLKENIANLANAIEDLEEDMIQERKTFAEHKENLQKELAETENNVQRQKGDNAKKRRQVDVITSELLDMEEKISEHKNCIKKLEKSISRLKDSALQHKKQYDEELNRAKELVSQKVCLAKELTELTERFQKEAQSLRDDIFKIDKEMEYSREVNAKHLQALTSLTESFQAARKREDFCMAVHLNVSKQLEDSKRKLEERIESIAKFKIEIREMEDEMKKLKESNEINSERWHRTSGELQEQLKKEKRNRLLLQAEKDNLGNKLAEKHKAYVDEVREMNLVIDLNKKKYAELKNEKKSLKGCDSVDEEIRCLSETLSKAQEAYKDMEKSLNTAVLQISGEAESLEESQQKKREQLKMSISTLQKAEAEFDTEHLNYQELKKQTAELKSKKNILESSILELREDIKIILEPKEELECEIETLRAAYMQHLKTQTTEICKTERVIYETGLMLERVNMENSRLHLCIAGLKEDINNVNKEAERHRNETQWLKDELHNLFKCLLKAWAEDTSLTLEYSEHDQGILDGMQELVRKIQQREQKIGGIGVKLKDQLDGITSLLKNAKRT
ncbi:coiled-coil domain-containing protein 175 [Lepisosteus oculatus]|uniref:coiled-coil domain-containing protein 175 n=1 Tax=Lepisosteus oculatus TaxID=7918 RepID=UPI0037153DEC